MDNEFNYINDEKKNNKIKIVVVIAIIMIVLIIILRRCGSKKSIELEKKEEIETTIMLQDESEEINRIVNETNIRNNEDLYKMLSKLVQYVKPKELIQFVDIHEYTIYTNDWDYYYNNGDGIIDMFEWDAYEGIINYMIYKNQDWSKLPLTEYFRKKFNFEEGLLNKWGLGSEEMADSIMLFHDEKYFIFKSSHGGLSLDEYYFNYSLDDNGFIDDIVFDRIDHIMDEEGFYIEHPDKYLMNNKENIQMIFECIIPYMDFGAEHEYPDDWTNAYYENVEFGFTDKFREYNKNLMPLGIIPLDYFEEYSVEDIDVENKHCVAKIIVDDDNVKYYDIYWTIDDFYHLDTVDVRLN